jgi:mannose-6-phosphate isomerase-like protein (cupin superfamily)
VAVVSITNAEHYIWGEKCDGWHLAKTSNLSVIQEKVPHGCSEIRHYHERSEQFFYVLSGIATIEVSGETFNLSPGNGIHVEAGMPHKLSNEQEHDLTFLVVSTPPSHGDRVIA